MFTLNNLFLSIVMNPTNRYTRANTIYLSTKLYGGFIYGRYNACFGKKSELERPSRSCGSCNHGRCWLRKIC